MKVVFVLYKLGDVAVEPMTVTETETISQLKIAADIERLADALPRLFAAVRAPAVREHPVWGTLIPYDVPTYGEGESLGHCVRPDIVVTEDGLQVSEFDCVPSGRGFSLNVLGAEALQHEFLAPFDAWYAAMGVNRVLYGTASRTTCWEETRLFSARLRDLFGRSIRPVNLDDTPRFDGVIDRLSYRSEMASSRRRELCLEGAQVITAEPYLDSKMLFALVHDSAMETTLRSYMSVDQLTTLREMIPETYAVEQCSPEVRQDIVGEFKQWVLKSTDVETDECWGSRGTIIGRKYTRSKFSDVLSGDRPINNKDIGRHPVLQRFAESCDFTSTWNRIAAGVERAADQSQFAHATHDIKPARKKVFARVGVYLLLSNTTQEVRVPPFAILTLRQDPLVHGAGDSVITVARMT